MPAARRLLAPASLIAALLSVTACAGDDGIGTGTPPDTQLTLTVTPKVDSLGIGMATQLTAAGQSPLLEPPGFLMLNYGRATPAVTLAGHVAYGTIVGGFAALAS